jgi:hypothetical protein
VPSNISRSRLRKAFNEGRRSATSETAENPYDNAKLRKLWDEGRSQQRAGTLTTPIPPLEHGETRAQRAPHNPPGAKRPEPRRAPAPGLGPRGPGGSGMRPGPRPGTRDTRGFGGRGPRGR